ncbi:MAG: PHP-associated domain-containing protein [Candidatus Hodarchaeales archaeon]
MTSDSELWDIHIHIRPDSFDAGHNLSEVLNNCSDQLSGIVITNHDIISKVPSFYQKKYDTMILSGVEVTSTEGHFLVFGILDVNFPFPTPFEILMEKVHENGAAMIGAHVYATEPYNMSEKLLSNSQPPKGLSGVEINGKWKKINDIKFLATRWNLPTVGGSDAHHIKQLNTMTTLFQREITDMDTLIQEIKAGRCKAQQLIKYRDKSF